MFIRDNARALQFLLLRNHVSKNRVSTLLYPPDPFDLALADFFPFPRSKTSPKGGQFANAEADKQNAIKQWRKITQNEFRKFFEQVCESWGRLLEGRFK